MGSVRGSVGGQLSRGSAFCRNPTFSGSAAKLLLFGKFLGII